MARETTTYPLCHGIVEVVVGECDDDDDDAAAEFHP